MLVTLVRISFFFGTFPYKYDDDGENVLNFSYLGIAISIFFLCKLLIIFTSSPRITHDKGKVFCLCKRTRSRK